MAEFAVFQQSNVDTAQRLRGALSGLLPATGALASRSGLFGPGGVVTLTSGMSVSVSPFRAYIHGTSATAQGGYLVVVDAAKTLTFADGGASARTDLIVARVRDTTFDGTGSTNVTVEIVQGVAGGGVPATPANSVKLAEKTITAGMSAGSGGLGTAPVDKRPPRLVSAGAVVPVADATDRDTLSTYPGLTVYRVDTKTLQTWDGTVWVQWPQPVTAWTPLPLSAGWTQRSGSVAIGYRVVDGKVELRGSIQKATAIANSGDTPFTLPAEARPNAAVAVSVAVSRGNTGGTTTGRLDIAATGVATMNTTSDASTWMSVDGVVFDKG